ncbi:ABC transporter ATP-binding protein [Patulibacter medicamentivorans]|uniref:ABC transporter ATP-binding protein n=1 Tax=Patulibacter medicamentivorans TaxID=1097667 RepID=H0E6I8_9ACTN|nr:ATP-binding cassette domain-containing protein [Patulibacter medicamentivorans]EHN10687.1 ABC transporter ATP-binding protein [Patulibacter medicamentivorans]
MSTTTTTAPPGAPDRPLAIDARGLIKRYGDVEALRGLDLQVPAGTVFGLLGPNGAGKSTTVKILTTLAAPTGGSATVAGADILRESGAVRRRIGVVSQASGTDKALTGRENLVLQGRIHGMGKAEARERADELLTRLRLDDARDRVVSGYSGGMQRRVDIATALMHRPQVLFLDEPTTGLDPEIRADLWQVVRELADDGMTVLLTTHYLEEADQLAAELAIVDRGRVVAKGTPAALKAELRGDAIVVELAAPAPEGLDVEALLRDAAGGLGEITVDGPTIRARVDRGAGATPQVLQALEARQLAVASITLSRPSLDDVYLRCTGRAFSAADQAGAAAPAGRGGRDATRSAPSPVAASEESR